MDFSKWLNDKLQKRGITQGELARRAGKSGYKISRSQITYILKGSSQAGPDACIAIAHGLDLPREEVFRARGWLLREPQEVIPPSATPSAAKLIRTLTNLDNQSQAMIADYFQGQIETIFNFKKLPIMTKQMQIT